MVRKIATALGFAKAPKPRYVLRHPVKGTKALIASKLGRSAITPRMGLALGAAIALPLGYLAVRSRQR